MLFLSSSVIIVPMSYYLIFLILFLSGLCLAYLTNKGIARTAAVVNFSLIAVLYICGLFARMDIGMYLFFALALLLVVFTVVKLVRKKDFRAFGKLALSPAGILYLVAAVMFGVLFTDLLSWHWDEVTHWALVVKNMVAYDNFGNIGDTTTMFNRYVPASGIFQYAFQFFNTTVVNGHFHAAFAVLVISMLLPVAELFKNKFSLGAILAPCLAVGIAMVMDTSLYSILFVDGLLGVATAYIYLAYLIDRKKTDWFTFVSIGLGAMVLTLIKSSGIALIVFALVFIVVDMLTRSRDNAKFFLKYRAWMFAIPVVLMVFAKVSWNVYCEAFSVRAGWNTSEMTLPNIISYMTQPNDFQVQVTKTFFYTYFVGPFRYDMSVFLQVPNLFLYAVVGALCFLLGWKTKNKVFAGVQFGTMILLLFGYGVVLLFLYIFSFTYSESLQLMCYGRYYSPMVIGTVLTLLYQCADVFLAPVSDRRTEEMSPEKKKKYTYISYGSFVAGVVTVAIVICAVFMPVIDRGLSEEYPSSYYRPWIDATASLTDNDSVYYVQTGYAEGTDGCLTYLKVRFLTTPLRCSGFSEGGSYTDGRNVTLPVTGNPFSMDMPEEEFIAETAKYGYLYVDDATDDFVAKFGKYFDGTPLSKVLYLRTEVAGEPLFILAP